MRMLLQTSLLALRSLTHPRLFRLLCVALVINLLVMTLLVGGVYAVLGHVSGIGWLDWLLQWGVTGISVILAYFIYPLVLPLTVSFFDTSIAQATEEIEYPNTPAAVPPFWPSLSQDIIFTAKVIVLNLLLLPFYLLPFVNIVAYYVLNGYLLGKEFFRVVAGRHMTPQDARLHWTTHRITLTLAGIVVAFGATIPVVNLICPVWAIVLMTHLLHRSKPRYKTVLSLENQTQI